MSTEASGSTQQASEQDVEIQQKESGSSKEKYAAEADVEQAKDCVEDGPESSVTAGADAASDQPESDQANDNIRSQDGGATGAGSVQNSKESSISNSNSGTESHHGVFCGRNSQEGRDSGTDSLPGLESRILAAVAVLGPVCVDPNIEDSQESNATGSSRTESSYETAAAGDSGTESIQRVEPQLLHAIPVQRPVGLDPNGLDSHQSSIAGSSRIERSYETAEVGDSVSAGSLENTVSGSGGSLGNGVASSNSESGNSLENNVASSNSVSGGSLEKGVAGGNSGSGGSLANGVAGGNSGSTMESQETPSSDSMALGADASHYPSVGVVRQSVEGSPEVTREYHLEGEPVYSELWRGYQEVFNVCAYGCDYLKPYLRRIRKSHTCSFLKLMLMIIPLLSFLMGMTFSTRCPVKVDLPVLMMVMGILGVVLLALCLGFDYRHILCDDTHERYKYFLKSTIIILGLFLLGLFTAALESTYSMSPSFDPAQHDKYCHMTFYYFAYYTNFIVIGILILSFFIYVPTWNEDLEEYERID